MMERQISFISRHHKVHGWAHIPKTPDRAPAIVLCHGFTGNCSEHGLFESFGKKASEAGFYVLRIDCVGSGESDGDFAEHTCLGGWRDDMLAAFDFAAKQPEVDTRRMAAMGISMGAGAALLSLKENRVKTAVGWAPVLYPVEVFSRIMGDENWEKLRDGETVHHEYAGVEFDMGPHFLRDAENLSVEQAIRESAKPVLLCLGTADPVIDPGFGPRMEALSIPGLAVRTVQNENHSFLVCQQENIAGAIEFLKGQLM